MFLNITKFKLDLSTSATKMPVDGLPLGMETALMSLLGENNMSSWSVGGEKYALLTLKFQVAMSEPDVRSGHSNV